MPSIPTICKNHAISTSLRESIEIHPPAITCTVNSTSTEIQSAVIAASYDFLLTNEKDKLLAVLEIAKKSKFTFPKGRISCDDFVKLPHSSIAFRLLIKFLWDKKKIEIKCFVKDGIIELGSITNIYSRLCKKFHNLYESIIEIEEEYERL